MQIIRAATLPLSRWTNGAGRKSDILTGDGWLIGFAWLDQDAPFSRLAGLDRTITLVEGPGFTLDIDNGSLPVDTPFQPARFDGGASTHCRIAGPSRVLNAMTDRVRFRHSVTILDRLATVDPGPSAACVLVALDAAIQVGTHRLERLDAARIAAPAELDIPTGGRVALIEIADAR